MKAHQILEEGISHMRDRAATYDKPEGERSMAQTVAIFNLFHGTDLTEAQGWHLLQILKDVRLFTRPGYHADSAEDCVAYAALKAEAMHGAAMSMIPESIRNHCGDFDNLVDELKTAGEWPEDQRIDAIGQNGNTGEHYSDGWDSAPKWASWKAQDSDKSWHWFEIKPNAAQGFWACAGGMMAGVEGGERGYNADWRLTLQARPF